ncbi:quinol:cytochrome C oxidoreductase [Pirellulaceae bacterium SH449]
MGIKYDKETIELPAAWKIYPLPLIAAGLILLVISYMVGLMVGGGPSDPERGMQFATHSYLANFMFLFSFSLGALFFIMVQFLTRAGWSTAVRRVAEIKMAILPYSALLFLPILGLVLMGSHSLYEWNQEPEKIHNSLIRGKVEDGYLQSNYFTLRSAVYIGLLTWMSLWFFSKSRAQDETGDPELSLVRQKWSGPFIMIYALAVSFLAFDWVMSVDAAWFSTIFGVYVFAASMLGFFSMMVIVNMLLERAGKLKGLINVEHYHDLAKFMFGFVMFWSYIAFSQLILIWYGNIPEETEWYRFRLNDGWQYYSYSLIFVHFAIPFLGLLSRHVRRHRAGLVFWACWLIAVHWMDMTYLVMPNVKGSFALVPMLGHLVGGIGALALFAGFFLLKASNVPLVAVRDPRMPESLTYSNPIL